MRKLPLKSIAILLLSAGSLITPAFAQVSEQASLQDRQELMLDKLDSMENSQAGFSIQGEIRGAWENSTISAEPWTDFSGNLIEQPAAQPSEEASAFTQANLMMIARPTAESRAITKIRIHRDWQNSYEEGPNPFQVNWFSYEGEISDRLVFRLGDFHTQYTPFTMQTPMPEILQEPEIFLRGKKDAMEERNLQGSDRLLQGLLVDYNSRDLSIFENIQVKANLARVRNIPKKSDQIWFDFDEIDRYTYGGRLGLSLFGATLGANYMNLFDRVKSGRNFESYHAFSALTGYNRELETNTVFSTDFMFDAGKLLNTSTFSAGVKAELALSNYKEEWDVRKTRTETESVMGNTNTYTPDGQLVTEYYLQTNVVEKTDWETRAIRDLDDQALIAGVFGAFRLPKVVDASLEVNMLDVGADFTSDLAQSTGWTGGEILNTQTDLTQAAPMSTTFEALYFSQHQVNPLTIRNSMQDPSFSGYYALSNNFEKEHFIRNGYSNVVTTKTEREIAAPATFYSSKLDLALPEGHATANRTGLDLNLDVWALDNRIQFQALTRMMDEKEAREMFTLTQDPALAGSKISFTELGTGLAVYINEFIGWSDKINLQVGYKQSEKKQGDLGMSYKVNNISAGLRAGFLNRFALLAGFQTLNGTFTPLDGAIVAAYPSLGGYAQGVEDNETLWMVGFEVELAKGSYLILERGMLENTSTLSAEGVSDIINEQSRDLTTAEVRVRF